MHFNLIYILRFAKNLLHKNIVQVIYNCLLNIEINLKIMFKELKKLFDNELYANVLPIVSIYLLYVKNVFEGLIIS